MELGQKGLSFLLSFSSRTHSYDGRPDEGFPQASRSDARREAGVQQAQEAVRAVRSHSSSLLAAGTHKGCPGQSPEGPGPAAEAL